jgi:tetratricopeptide (TPR) repeat protein
MLLKKKLEETTSNMVAFSFIRRNYVIQTNVVGWRSNNGEYPQEEAGTGFFIDEVVRLFPNNKNIFFKNAVHEQIEPSLTDEGIEIIKCKITIHHYGKLDAEKVSSKDKYYYNLGEMQLKNQSDLDFRVLHNFGVQSAKLSHYKKAIRYFENVIKLAPDFPMSYLSMGNAYYNLCKYDIAKSSYKKAIELDPNLDSGVKMYSICEIYTGNAKTAIQFLEALIQKNPHHPHYISLLAAAYICSGNINFGLAQIEKLRSLNFDYKSFFIQFVKQLTLIKQLNYASLLEDVLKHES